MASSPIGPPPQTARRVMTNRSFTLPTKLADTRNTAPTAEIGTAESIETLYSTPNANVVKFSTAGIRPLRPRTSGSVDSPDGKPQGTMPWASSTERTIAAGPLEIYRVLGSVSFLHSGDLLHAILPRSQCWCVDGVSKFAFRVLPDTYYRIELPGKTEEDMAKVEQLKETFGKVLFYERTPCPFSRTFTVELPDEVPKVRKSRRQSLGPAKKWRLARAYTWKPEDGEEAIRPDSQDSSAGSLTGLEEETDDSARDDSNGEGETAEASELADEVNELNVSTPTKIKSLKGMRSVSAPAPPQLTYRSTPPSKIQTTVFPDGTVQASGHVPGATPNPLDPARLETFQAIPTQMPPSPPDSSSGIELSETTRLETWVNQSGVNLEFELTAAAEDNIVNVEQITDGSVFMEPLCTREPVPDANAADSEKVKLEPQKGPESGPAPPRPHALLEQIASIERSASQDRSRPSSARSSSASSLNRAGLTEDPFAAIQARITARKSIGGTTAFHPSRSEASLSASTSLSSTRSTVSLKPQHPNNQAFTRALVGKAYTTVFGPPAHLVAIMLRIAARFANSAFRNTLLVQSPPGKAKVVPGSFDLRSIDAEDFDEDADDLGGEQWDEDDFGVPMSSPVRVTGARERQRQRLERTRGWEVD